MPSTLIFGGSGKVARHLTKLLVSQGQTVHSIIRNPAQVSELSSLGAKPVVQSIEESSVSELASAIRTAQPDVLVWSAGAGGGNPERTKAVDNEGAIKVFDAAAESGVKRFIMVSAADLRDKENKPEPEWYNDGDRDRSNRIWGAIGPYMEAKYTADRDLVMQNEKRGLKYTIVRPGGLSQDPSSGTVAAGKVHLNQTISREDVAGVIAECIKNEDTIGLAFDVVGGATPIEQAIKEVADGRVDTFAGRY